MTDLSRPAVIEQLWPAIEDGLLIPVPDTGAPSRYSDLPHERSGRSQAALQFAHDRVQQAAYGRLSK